MNSHEKYADEVRRLVAKGVNFEQNVCSVSSSVRGELDVLAQKYGYKGRKDAYLSRSGQFYLCLKRVYEQMMKQGDFSSFTSYLINVFDKDGKRVATFYTTEPPFFKIEEDGYEIKIWKCEGDEIYKKSVSAR